MATCAASSNDYQVAADCPSPSMDRSSKLCIKLGARLCTSDELQVQEGLSCPNGATTGRDGETGKRITTTKWSSTHCGIGGSNYLVQHSDGKTVVELNAPNTSARSPQASQLRYQ